MSISMAGVRTAFLKTKYLARLLASGVAAEKPFHCHYQVTRRCNFRCESCRVWRDAGRHDELGIDEMMILAANLRRIGAASISITGGEPLMRTGIEQAVGVFKKSGLIVRLQTNGSLLDENMSRNLIANGVDDIYVSLDTLDPSEFARINGVDNPALFDKVLANTKYAASVLRTSGGSLFLTAVLRASNAGEVDALYDFAERLGCFIGFYGLEVGDANDPVNIRAHDPHLLPDGPAREHLLHAFKRVKELRRNHRSAIFMSEHLIDDYIRFYSSDAPVMKWACRAGDNYLEIMPDGSVGICNGTPPLDGYTYKNLAQLYSFPGRRAIFEDRRKRCSGCICTRQLDYLVADKKDIMYKAMQYLSHLFARKRG